MKHVIMLMAAGPLFLAGAPAWAQNQADLRCLMVSNFFQKSGQGDRAKKIAEATAYYYLGRIQGQFTDPQLKAALSAQAKALKGAKMGELMAQCANQMTS